MLVVACTAVVGWPILLGARRRLAGTTLTAPWVWSAAVFGLLLLFETMDLLVGAASGWREHTRYLVAIASFGPLMALLGAKRPQDVAWQFIVFSLLVVLALPGLQSAVFYAGDTLDLHAAWRWFLLLLLMVGPADFLLTRYWAAGCTWGAAQACLLGSWLPAPLPYPEWRGTLALLLLAMALCLAARAARGRVLPTLPLDRLWLDFRDLFGTLWALRVAERINASARMYQWPVWQSWQGLLWTDRPGQPPTEPTTAQPAMPSPELYDALLHGYRTLLRRFVDAAWIEQRCGEP